MLFAYSTGLMLSLSLILAIGSQNAFVLRQGILRQHVLPIVLFCAVADTILIITGVFGLPLLLLIFWSKLVHGYSVERQFGFLGMVCCVFATYLIIRF